MSAAAVKPAATEEVPSELRPLALTDLVESPWNPRQHYDAAKLEELAASLRAKGQLTPIVVRPRPPKTAGSPVARYEIGAGHRRFRAAQLAGLTHLLAVIRRLDDVAFTELLTVENLQRDDLHPLEEAQGFRDLMERAGYDVAKIAARVGRSVKYVYDRIKLLQLTPEAKKLFLAGSFEAGHAILLARLSPSDQKRAIGDLREVADSGEYAAHRVSLLLRPDDAADGELPLHDQVKPVSVREFQQAIQEKIRATPERLDPFLFPESAKALEAAKEEKLGVIHITREYRVDDEASDEKIKTYGSQGWKRADGQVEEEGDYLGRQRKTKSKPCDWSRYGFVVSGPGQGEVFRVCINKQKCKIHWPEHVKRAEAAKKRTKKPLAGADQPQIDRDDLEEQRREAEAAERARWKRALPQLRTALAEKIRTAQTGPTSLLGAAVLKECRAFYWENAWAQKVMPLGRTAEDVVRRAAWLVLSKDLNEHRAISTCATLFKRFGLDARKIVDQVAPAPKPEKPAAKTPTKKKAKRGKG